MLKDYDQCKKTYADEFAQYVTQNIQVENVRQFPNHIEDDNTDKYIDGDCSFNQSVGIKKKQSDQKNINNVDEGEI